MAPGALSAALGLWLGAVTLAAGWAPPAFVGRKTPAPFPSSRPPTTGPSPPPRVPTGPGQTNFSAPTLETVIGRACRNYTPTPAFMLDELWGPNASWASPARVTPTGIFFRGHCSPPEALIWVKEKETAYWVNPYSMARGLAADIRRMRGDQAALRDRILSLLASVFGAESEVRAALPPPPDSASPGYDAPSDSRVAPLILSPPGSRAPDPASRGHGT
ncbi:envelope glycoprotein L [Beluga whale alphaherpesvirus 1]|uniref:Envelope glycoprotein L n=1 Tax=Beluga whale alphaherpesvirus 1 TaxID=1434720 RepID=A0A286RUF2_9ALPH|nr:envelope glycoprotein L [Beluga whale alphaherpesvirus 1]ASW27049.1 envelope glycoprotein L [Beluga whale alphaherpesvirus 1]